MLPKKWCGAVNREEAEKVVGAVVMRGWKKKRVERERERDRDRDRELQ